MSGVPVRALDEAARSELIGALRRLRTGRGLTVRLAELAGTGLLRFGRVGLARLGIRSALLNQLRPVAEMALRRAFTVAILGMDTPARGSPGLSRALVVVSGAASGFVGLPGFLPDATVTTLTIMREVARVAEEEGEDLSDEGTRHACLEVFAFSEEAETDELGYLSARLLLQGSPMIGLLGQAASRYGMVLGEKLSLQAVPLLGAVTAAALNAAFLEHYRGLAQAHFTIRRLERLHGEAAVREAIAASGLAPDVAAEEPFADISAQR